MDVLVERCAGLDVHRDTVVATVRRSGSTGARRSQTRTFSTMTSQLEELADWLVSEKVTLAGMESTGVYWKPVYYVLEERLPVWVINAEHLRNVPGRKTDVADSVWIAQLIEHGLVSPSFVPPRHIRLLRDLTRHGRRLTEERTRTIQRLEKVLQDAPLTELPGRWFVSWVGLERCEATVRPRGWGSGDAAGSGVVGGAAVWVAGGDRRGVRAVPAA
jgi:transposase